MSRHIYLLTFDKLPNRQLAGEDSPFTQAYERLDSTSAFFEQHYLQLDGSDAILGNTATAKTLESYIQDSGVTAIAVSVGFRHEGGFNSADLPKYFQRKTVADMQNFGGHLPNAPSKKFVWIHSALNPADSEADQCRQFEQCVNWCHQQLNTSDSMLIVSSINGVEPNETPFESVMFDSLVRVPLWVEFQPQIASRIQCSTGSFDVLQTVIEWVKEDSDVQLRETTSQTLSLVELVQRTGESTQRTIDIRTQNVIASRTNDFMFCQPLDENDLPNDFVSQPGLYAKPEDIWNIHDVSAEYHDVIRDFQSRLQQSK